MTDISPIVSATRLSWLPVWTRTRCHVHCCRQVHPRQLGALVERADGRRGLYRGEEPRPSAARSSCLYGAEQSPRRSTSRTPSRRQTRRQRERRTARRWQSRSDDLAAMRRTLLDSGELSLAKLADRIAARG